MQSRYRFGIRTLGAQLALSVALFTPVAQAATNYRITNLGTLGGDSSMASDINNLGQIVGMSTTAEEFCSGGLCFNRQHPFLYSNGAMIDLGTLGGALAQAQAINDMGQITGSSSLAGDGLGHPFLYSGGTMKDLGTFGGSGAGYGQGINNAGQITGYVYSPGVRGFVYDIASETYAYLPSLGGQYTYGEDINDAGQVTGNSRLQNNNTNRAILYENGTTTDLGTLGGQRSLGYAINALGQATGSADLGNGDSVAFLYSSGVMTSLGLLPGGNQSRGLDINDGGIVVGNAYDANNDRVAMIYRDGAIANLNDLIDPASGWTLEEATGINNQGQIVGYGVFDDQTRAFLLTPVPEPESCVLILAGLGWVWLAARRRRRAAA